MKSLKEYLIESKQQYEYRIKIAGEISTDVTKQLERSFAEFDVSNITKPKRTPIMKNPTGFMGVSNKEVNIIDVTFNYPASTEQFVQAATNAGISANNIIVISKAYDDSMSDEENGRERSGDGTLLGKDYQANTSEQEQCKDDYRTSHQAIVQNADISKYEVAGGKTPKAKTSNDFEQGTDSPFTKVDNTSPV